MIYTVSVPRSIFDSDPIYMLVEIGIIQNMTFNNTYEYKEIVDRYFFYFEEDYLPMVKRVLSRMFKENHAQVLYG